MEEITRTKIERGKGGWIPPESSLKIKKIDEKIRYASSRGIEGITFPSNTPIREETALMDFLLAEATRFEALTEKHVFCRDCLITARRVSGTLLDPYEVCLFETEDLICEEVFWNNCTGVCYTNSPWFSPIFGESEWVGDKRKRPVGPNRTKARLLPTLLDRKLDSHTEKICDCVWLQMGRLEDYRTLEKSDWSLPDEVSTTMEEIGVCETTRLPGR
ncbi:hypothetical protein DPMN_035499 [Dreissena polymorpha]|uniref:Uncharacterized protein n=1 Tax=Dreissena polymorpha TaxID=45954 RepID=A0A9D4M9M2_DREPO|nr:hypothetical protein DPMN_035499 [Dreissena polymorpha]